VLVTGDDGRVSSPVVPEGYPEFLAGLKEQVTTARLRATRVVNTELIALYWDIGAAIMDRQDTQGWGATVVDRLATDLRAAFPDMRGFSRSNLYAMRRLARTWPRTAIVQQAVGRLPWGHVTVLLDKLTTDADRDFYAEAALEHGWSRNVLTHHIATSLRTRIGAAPSNFTDQLPAGDSDLAQQLVRDPYVFDFLNLTTRVAERDLEDALMGRLQRFLLELGHGFAFVGRQHRFTVDGQDFAIDLLFFNYTQSRFVVIELKIGTFEPAYLGQLGFYVAWADDNLRDHTRHSPTIGILLCTGGRENVVRYSLAAATAPLAVATFTYDALPATLRELLPTDTELTTALTTDSTVGDPPAGDQH
jgi:predicted nuclease of restriction endonuclease-like (RecB) superfamily